MTMTMVWPARRAQNKGKTAAVQINSDDNPDLPLSQSATEQTGTAAAPVRKGRGRPRKTATAVATAGTADVGAAEEHPDLSEAAAGSYQLPQAATLDLTSPGKKPRGRPRKVVAAASAQMATEVTACAHPVSGHAGISKLKQGRQHLGDSVNTAGSSHVIDVCHSHSYAQQSGQSSAAAMLDEERQQPGNAEELLQDSPTQASPGARLSDLPLRDRLDRIQQLLTQAGCSDPNRLQQRSALLNPGSSGQLASKPILPIPSPQHTDSWQQPRAVPDTFSHTVTSASLQLPLSPCQDLTHSPHDSFSSELMCLLSPSPTHLSPQLQSPVPSQTNPQRAAVSPTALCELTELITSVQTDMRKSKNVDIDLASVLHSELMGRMKSPVDPNLMAADTAVLEEVEHEACEPNREQSGCESVSPAAFYTSASCCPSPVLQRVDNPQQGKKRSR